mgnify:CR=1 FL=1
MDNASDFNRSYVFYNSNCFDVLNVTLLIAFFIGQNLIA